MGTRGGQGTVAEATMRSRARVCCLALTWSPPRPSSRPGSEGRDPCHAVDVPTPSSSGLPSWPKRYPGRPGAAIAAPLTRGAMRRSNLRRPVRPLHVVRRGPQWPPVAVASSPAPALSQAPVRLDCHPQLLDPPGRWFHRRRAIHRGVARRPL